MPDEFLQSGQQVVERIFKEFAPELEQVLRNEIRRKKLVDSGELLNSLRTQLQQQAEAQQTLLLGFANYGFWQDRRKFVKIDSPPVFLKWVDSHFEKFGFVSGYKAGREPIREQAVKRIAFAIRAKQAKQGFIPKGRTWLYKKFWTWYRNMIEALLDNLSEEQIKALLSDAKQQ